LETQNYEEVNVYPLEPEVLEQLLREQRELCFMWGTKDHWAVGVFMSYVWRDGSFWVTSTTQRARMRAIERDPRVSVAVTSVGTSLGPSKTATAKGRVRIHDDEATKQWFYPALSERVIPGLRPVQRAFAALLNSERRVVLEVVPEKWMTFDASKMMADTASAMAKVAMPERFNRLIQQLGGDPDRIARVLVNAMGLQKPRGLMGPGERVHATLRRMLTPL
jgi:hypothetical protein